jgi:hypothetical protein
MVGAFLSAKQEKYADISQKWVVIHSKLMHAREVKTFNKNLKKDYNGAWDNGVNYAYSCSIPIPVTIMSINRKHERSYSCSVARSPKFVYVLFGRGIIRSFYDFL